MIGQKIKQLLAIVVASMSTMMVFMSLYNVYVTYQITVEESEGLSFLKWLIKDYKTIRKELFATIVLLILLIASFIVIKNKNKVLEPKKSPDILPKSWTGHDNKYLPVKRQLLDRIKRAFIDSHQKELRERRLDYELDGIVAPVNSYQRRGASSKAPKQTTLTNIKEEFDCSGKKLLILGQPGSGKTYVMYKVWEVLHAEAEKDLEARVPLLLNLSTWQSEQTIEMWVAEQLHHVYGVPKKVAALLAEDRGLFTYLFDGLDEVAEEHRSSCLKALKEFMKSGGVTYALSCRSKEYDALDYRICEGDFIRLNPLKIKDVNTYIEQLSTQRPEILTNYRSFYEALEDDLGADGAESFLSTPLMICILTVILTRGQLANVHKEGQTKGVKEQMYHQYIQTVVHSRKAIIQAQKDYSGKKITGEEKVEKEQKTSVAIFYLQHLAGRMKERRKTYFQIHTLQPIWCKRKWLFELIFGLILWLMGWLVGVLIFGQFWGLIFGQIAVGIGSSEIAIREGYNIVWNKNRLVSKLVSGLDVGLMGGLILGLSFWPFGGLIFGFIWGLSCGLIWGLSCGLVSGWIELNTFVQDKKPNEPVWNSLRCVRLPMAIVVGLVIVINVFDMREGATSMLGTIIFLISFSAFYVFGAFKFLQHYVLRLVLRWERVLPHPLSDKRLVQYLDGMRDLMLLQRVGTGWKFMHKEILDYLATKPFGDTPEAIQEALKKAESCRS